MKKKDACDKITIVVAIRKGYAKNIKSWLTYRVE